ncbi:hypothetical protein Nepgr_001584 [Nepenthes gracilis]|uniref:Uncharacterized protein n=1 Tax=Nepenthes gracilis TaxID=150966 RepID=A0AAD3P2V1_NEPGR|nr:hypothetical protein Nepgr_001584 [Nepenthes gracilis]
MVIDAHAWETGTTKLEGAFRAGFSWLSGSGDHRQNRKKCFPWPAEEKDWITDGEVEIIMLPKFMISFEVQIPSASGEYREQQLLFTPSRRKQISPSHVDSKSCSPVSLTKVALLIPGIATDRSGELLLSLG